MRLSRTAPLLALLVACGGKSDDSSAPPPPSCDSVQTTPIDTMSPDDYPEGLAGAIDALQNLEGLWRAPHCSADGRTIDIKITDLPGIPDEIQVVTQPVAETADCGCTADLTYAQDNALDQVGIIPAFTLTITPQDVPEASLDPALDDQQFEVTGSLFAGTQGLHFRACQDRRVEPYLNSEYDTVVVNVRIQTATETTPLSHLGDVTLETQLIKQAAGEDPVVCTVTDFVKVQ